MRFHLVLAVLSAAACACGSAIAGDVPPPAPIDSYSIHADGGLIYNPLSREATRTGQLAKYAKVPTTEKTVRMGDYTATFRVPTKAVGYDVLPIPYTLKWTGKPDFPLGIEATAFEDEARRKGRDLFDLSLPGKLDLQVDYLGSITAHMKPGARHNLKADYSDTPGVYPAFERRAMVRSGVVESGDIIWFQFRVKNTGNTILDPEGFGGWGLYPELQKKDEKGEFKHYANHYNLYIRDRKYLYPGESRDFWINFMDGGSFESY